MIDNTTNDKLSYLNMKKMTVFLLDVVYYCLYVLLYSEMLFRKTICAY